MSNMSYCRFQNTSNDFSDCVDHFEEGNSFEDLSLEEQDAAKRLYLQAREYIEMFEDDTGMDDEDRMAYCPDCDE